MRCPAIAEPAGPGLDDLRLWAFDLVQSYERCATRHNDCAARLAPAEE